MNRLFRLLAVSVLSCASAFAQSPNVENFLSMIDAGQAEQVRAEVPSLLAQYPNNPGVLYLQAVLTTDGAEAVRLYQNIVDNFPKSEWADDALFKVYKFYQAIGLFRTADIKLNQLKTNYPESKHVTGDVDMPPVTENGTDTAEARATETPAQSPAITKSDSTTPVLSPVKQPVPPATTGIYTLQVGVYSTAANAGKQKLFFEYQKYAAEVATKMKGSKELFAVYVGSYATADEATAAGDEIKRSFNIDYIVVTR